MKKFWQVVSKKDLIFGLIILALTIVISLKPSNKVRVQFEEAGVDIVTTKYSMNIPYDMVASIALVEKPELGEQIDGYNDNIVAYGIWKNDTWGEYYIVADLDTSNCIVLRLIDGRTFVFSCKDDETTVSHYEQLRLHLN